jgi:hypothetical protein
MPEPDTAQTLREIALTLQTLRTDVLALRAELHQALGSAPGTKTPAQRTLARQRACLARVLEIAGRAAGPLPRASLVRDTGRTGRDAHAAIDVLLATGALTADANGLIALAGTNAGRGASGE